MNAFRAAELCEANGVKSARRSCAGGWIALLWIAVGFSAAAQDTNKPGTSSASAKTPPPQNTSASRPGASPSLRLDESAFRLVGERNIFNANRSGGQVRPTSTRRPSRVESFTLVGTIAYEKGAFAFFQGSSSELTKVLKPEGVIAGHKVVDILAEGVKLEADGEVMDLAMGSTMRREDEGAWKLGSAVAGSYGDSSRQDEDDSSSSRGRDDRRFSTSSSSSSVAQADNHRQDKQDRKDEKKEIKLDAKAEADILKRLMERREKESE
jgi:hypothetical protein